MGEYCLVHHFTIGRLVSLVLLATTFHWPLGLAFSSRSVYSSLPVIFISVFIHNKVACQELRSAMILLYWAHVYFCRDDDAHVYDYYYYYALIIWRLSPTSIIHFTFIFTLIFAVDVDDARCLFCRPSLIYSSRRATPLFCLFWRHDDYHFIISLFFNYHSLFTIRSFISFLHFIPSILHLHYFHFHIIRYLFFIEMLIFFVFISFHYLHSSSSLVLFRLIFILLIIIVYSFFTIFSLFSPFLMLFIISFSLLFRLLFSSFSLSDLHSLIIIIFHFHFSLLFSIIIFHYYILILPFFFIVLTLFIIATFCLFIIIINHFLHHFHNIN